MIKEPIELIEMPYPTSSPSLSIFPSVSIHPTFYPTSSSIPTTSSSPSKSITLQPTPSPTEPCKTCPPFATGTFPTSGSFPATDCSNLGFCLQNSVPLISLFFLHFWFIPPTLLHYPTTDCLGFMVCSAIFHLFYCQGKVKLISHRVCFDSLAMRWR